MNDRSADLRVAVIEDDPRYRSSLEQLVAHTDGFHLAASFWSPPSALDAAERAFGETGRSPWDIIVMDLAMPRMGGIEATRRLKALLPEVKIVVLTVFEEPSAILEAICAGADGYLLKKARARELLDGFRAVAQDGSPLTSNVARKVLELVRAMGPSDNNQPSPSPSRFDLTEREQEILRGLADGLSYKQLSDAFGIALGTVRTHIRAIYRKLQVHSVSAAVSRAIRQRLI